MKFHSDPGRRDKLSACIADEISRQFHTDDEREWAKNYLEALVEEALRTMRAIRLPEVLSMVGCSKSHWYSMHDPRSPAYDPAAPRSFKLGRSDRSPTLWWQHEIQQYLEDLAEEQRMKRGGRNGRQ